jgi:hypothetical protein
LVHFRSVKILSSLRSDNKKHLPGQVALGQGFYFIELDTINHQLGTY